MKIPFGKYEGEDIEDIPHSYLLWLERECTNDTVREAAENEVRRRIDNHEEYDQ